MLAVAVLAAGKGTRMKSALPKVLQPLGGATLVERVLASAGNLLPERRILIVGHQAARVEQRLSHIDGLEFVVQEPQNGTGHAVQQLLPPLQDFAGELLVLNGDVPNSPGLRRRRSRVPSEEDDKLINFLVAGGHDGSRERNTSLGNIGELCFLYIYLI